MLPKTPTGIRGLDEITLGGLPRGRATLVCGGAGCGKTQLGLEFLVHGALDYDEPGVLLSFEESAEDIIQNARSLGFDLDKLVAKKKLLIDPVRLERNELTESGEYDLEGLFVRLGHAIDSIGAKRVVLDTIEILFSALTDRFIVRSELGRLFRWLKARKVTSVVTGERGNEHLTRHGLEEYVSDCVILLDQRQAEQSTTRRLRVVKYRGSAHDSNEVPFLIDSHGFSVLPVTSMGLSYEAPTSIVTSGLPALDGLFQKGGYFSGSSVLVSGTAGSGKSTIAAYFADGTARAGRQCLYLAFEESADQIVRNMGSIGLDLERWRRRGLLRIHAERPTAFGLEAHLVRMHRHIAEFAPSAVILDPVSNLVAAGSQVEVKMMLARVIDFLKRRSITSVFTSLHPADEEKAGDIGVSSLMDVWMLVQNRTANSERNRTLQIVKARGMAHSNQVREFVIGNKGIELVVGARRDDGTVSIGAARAGHGPPPVLEGVP